MSHNEDIMVCCMQKSITIAPQDTLMLPVYYLRSPNVTYDFLYCTTVLQDNRNKYITMTQQIIDVTSDFSEFHIPASNISDKNIHYKIDEPIAVLTPLCKYEYF